MPATLHGFADADRAGRVGAPRQPNASSLRASRGAENPGDGV